MTDKQKLEIALADARKELRSVILNEESTDEEITAAEQKVTSLERRVALLPDEPDPTPKPDDDDAEAREFRELEGRVEVGNYVAAALNQELPGGAEAEFNQACEMSPGSFPLRLLAPEVRATTDADGATAQQSWVDRLFAGMASERVGVTRRSVRPGVASVPVMGGTMAGAERSRGQAIADGAWSVASTEIKPGRFGVRAVYTAEDAARLPGLSDAIRRDMRRSAAEGLDRIAFLGDTSPSTDADDVKGLFDLTNAAEGIIELTLTQADKLLGEKVLAEFVGLLDGKGAGSLGDLGIVASVASAKLWEGSFIAATAARHSDATIAQFLRSAGVGWGVRGELEDAATTNGKLGAIIGKRRNIAGSAVHAIWEQGRMIVDPYSKSATGETILTLQILHGLAFPRASSFAKLTYVS